MADQLSKFMHDLTRQLRESQNEQRRTQEKYEALQTEFDSVQGRLQILQDADVARAQRLLTLQEELRSTKSDLEEVRNSLHEREDRLAATRSKLEQAPESVLSGDQRQAIEELLTSVVQNPKDIDVLMRTAQDSADILSVVNEAKALRAVVDSVTGGLA
jgi:chromosome segregation ATPase